MSQAPGLYSGHPRARGAAAEGTDRLILTGRDLQDPSLYHQTATPLGWNRQKEGSSRGSPGQPPWLTSPLSGFGVEISLPKPGLLFTDYIPGPCYVTGDWEGILEGKDKVPVSEEA